MKRRSVSLILVGLMLSLVISACGGGAQNTNANTKSTAPAPAQSTAAAAETKAAASTAQKLPLLEVSAILPIWESVPDMNNGWWTRFFNETNTKWKIEWVPAADIATKFDLVLASGTLPDVFFGEDISRPTLVSAIKQGAFADLTPILGDFSKYPNLKNNMNPNVMNLARVDGKYYGIPRNRPQIDQGIKIRADWLKKLNLEMPKTLDEFYTYIKKSVENKLGGNETVGLPTLWCSENVIVGGYGAYDIQKNSDGDMIYWMLNDGYTDSVEFFRKLYSEGLMPKEYFTLTYSDYQGLFTTGRAATFTENIWRDYDMQTKIKATQPDAIVETIVEMKGPKGYAARIEKGFYGAFYLSKKIPNDKLLRLMDYYELTCSEYWLDKGYYGWEGVHYTKSADGTRTMTEVGTKEVAQTSVQQPLPMMKNTWAKVIMPAAPKAYNDAKLKRVEPIMQIAKVNPFEVLVSAEWTKLWGKASKEFNQMRTKCICGQISVEEYKKYVKDLRETPEAKKAFKEFSADYAVKYGK